MLKRLLSVSGALVLVGAVVAVVVWQRPEVPPPVALKDVVVQYADGTRLWSTEDGAPQTPLVTQVLTELRRQGSFDLDGLRRVGATVVTTIDPKAQGAGASVLDETARAQPPSLRFGLTAVDPATGGVLAYVPGAQGPDATDYAGGVLKQPGTTFYPINVVAGMKEGHQLDSVFDGTPRKIAGVAIRDDVTFGKTSTVRDALARSSAVVMYDLVANEVGVKGVQKAAHQAGVPESVVIDGKDTPLLVGEGGGLPRTEIALGTDEAAMRPLDLTTVYATFASGGVHRRTHFVTKVSADDGSALYQVTESASAAFDPDIAVSKEISSRITTVLKDSTACPGAVCRTARYATPPDAAGQDVHAWTTGYTDRMAITVLVTTANPKQPVTDAVRQTVEDIGLPKAIWQGFAEKA
ncbi:penicillin-binding transpeptidase domain-containing protein [Streptomyces sp. ID05-26A]|nr:penicillin-binding transpeptidase domain-containing protein [Streptomyces sp. ID05-26A]